MKLPGIIEIGPLKVESLRCFRCDLPLEYPYTTVHLNLLQSFDYHNDCLRKSIVETA